MKREARSQSPHATRRGGKSESKGSRRVSRFTLRAKVWIGIVMLILLSPLGLFLPELFNSDGAWGEWGADEIKDIAGYVPEGLKRISELWSAPIPDYAFTGWGKGVKSYIAYIISGIIGVVIVVVVAYIFGKILKRGER